MNRLLLLVLLFACRNLNGQAIFWISACGDKTFCLNQNSCTEGDVMLTEEAVTTCVNGPLVSYLYKIDLFNNGGVDMQASNDTVSGPFPLGTHKITWRANDNCGNVIQCTYLFTIKDCFAPNMLCINSLSQNLEPTCITTAYFDDFVLNASDNCTPGDMLVFGMREVGTGTGFPPETSISFGACDLGPHDLEIWVKDENGLQNKCISNIVIQDNANNCDCFNGSGNNDIDLQGCMKAANGQKLSHYSIRGDLVATPVQGGPPTPLFIQPDLADSCYHTGFQALPPGFDYQMTVRGRRNDNPLLGVSTLDLLQITKHILNIQPFQTLYQWLAADVNASGSVTTFDIVETRKLILGIYDTFPAVQSWRFIRPLTNPGNFMSAVKDTYQIALPNLAADTSFAGLDFVGIKMGDVNLSATFAGDPVDRSPLVMTAGDQMLRAGEEATVPVRWGADAALEGWQTALALDASKVELASVEGLPSENYHVKDGQLRLLWFDPAGRHFSKGDVVFRLKIRALQPTFLSDALTLSPAGPAPEAYPASNGEVEARRPLELRFNEKHDGSVAFFPPRPNPFRDQTIFEFVPDDAGQVRLELFDMSGKRVFEKTADLNAGRNAIAVSASGLPGSGMYFYRAGMNGKVYAGKLVRE